MPNRAKEIEKRLERAEQELRLIQKISRYMVRDMSLGDALREVVALVVEFMQCDSCLIYLLDDDRLVLCAANERTDAVGSLRVTLNEGLTGWVARERRLLAISREAYADPRFKCFKELPEDMYEAFLSAPLICRNRVVGVINVQHRAPHSHTGEELEMIHTVSEQVGCLLLLAHAEAAGADLTRNADLVLATPSK